KERVLGRDHPDTLATRSNLASWTGKTSDTREALRLFAEMRAIRSIFSTCNALRQGGVLTLPDVPASVCYPNGRCWQRRGPKLGGQRNLDPRIGRGRASQHGDCQHQGPNPTIASPRANWSATISHSGAEAKRRMPDRG